MEWISVNDRLPNKKEAFITFNTLGVIQIRKYCTYKFAECGKYKITHWMPLPPLPKE